MKTNNKFIIRFDERALMIVNQIAVFIVSLTSLVYGLLIYFNFVACNCFNFKLFNLEQKIEQYGLAVVGEMIMDLMTLPLVLYNISRLYQHLEFHCFFELLFVVGMFIRIISGSLMYFLNLQEDQIAYFSYNTFHTYCQSFLNITQDQCTVLKFINYYSDSNLSLVCLTTFNLLFFIMFYHLNYKKDKKESQQLLLELQQDLKQ